MAIMMRCRIPPDTVVRILPHPPFALWDTHELQRFNRALCCLFAAHAFVHAQGFHDLVAHAHMRCERGQRILEDHGDLRAANMVQLAFRGADQLLPR